MSSLALLKFHGIKQYTQYFPQVLHLKVYLTFSLITVSLMQDLIFCLDCTFLSWLLVVEILPNAALERSLLPTASVHLSVSSVHPVPCDPSCGLQEQTPPIHSLISYF